LWKTHAQRLLKRCFDISVVTLSLPALLPVIGIVGLLIKSNSAGPIFFRQKRIGLNGKVFVVYKFRTMVQDAEAVGRSVTTKEDARVTSLGAILRKRKVDELPQIFNVLKGDMSLVGPRCTVEEDFLRMDRKQRERFWVKPGLTGLAQIRGNTSIPWPMRIKYDLEYVEKQAVLFDIRIIFETILMIFRGSIETHPAGEDEWKMILE
jgi:lipopolysaccharide/colanic/teichoic acid biosynthesis glycosyltransferase